MLCLHTRSNYLAWFNSLEIKFRYIEPSAYALDSDHEAAVFGNESPARIRQFGLMYINMLRFSCIRIMNSTPFRLIILAPQYSKGLALWINVYCMNDRNST
jgi:hypothetical protein